MNASTTFLQSAAAGGGTVCRHSLPIATFLNANDMHDDAAATVQDVEAIISRADSHYNRLWLVTTRCETTAAVQGS
jgi:hypothetical protein